MNEKYCVYCHISPNGKRYIGITCKPPQKRWVNGYGYTYNTHFYKAIKKYGWDAFEHIILYDGLTKEWASMLEIELIAKYDTTNQKKGYNIASGGFGGGHPTSEETKQKISIANRGRPCPEHQKKHLSEINKGKMPTNLDAIHKGNMKPVDQFDKDWNYIASYPSIRIAARMNNFNENSIACVCRGLYNFAGGYRWAFSNTKEGLL